MDAVETGFALSQIDTTTPYPARIYDALLSGRFLYTFQRTAACRLGVCSRAYRPSRNNVRRVLEDLFKWEHPQIDTYVAVLAEAAEHSGGGLLMEVPRMVRDCRDHEDNLVLDLAAEVGAMLIVSNDTDLLSMSPWRGTPILTPVAFAAKVAAMRRHARRRRR
jgi:hypothetical protein